MESFYPNRLNGSVWWNASGLTSSIPIVRWLDIVSIRFEAGFSRDIWSDRMWFKTLHNDHLFCFSMTSMKMDITPGRQRSILDGLSFNLAINHMVISKMEISSFPGNVTLTHDDGWQFDAVGEMIQRGFDLMRKYIHRIVSSHSTLTLIFIEIDRILNWNRRLACCWSLVVLTRLRSATSFRSFDFFKYPRTMEE